MFEVKFIANGYFPIKLGSFGQIQDAVAAIKEHVRVHSAISVPRYAKSWHDNHIRIDYGAKDCYYLITKKLTEEIQND
ncbi:hypothetical protein [Streptococcus suis]|uniref:hypothetical protein n=1 Tax=Streptococcus suis TaxID=1307 RepID=UPI001ABE91A8|nr:hypothetical protein [Streptococcus suis]